MVSGAFVSSGSAVVGRALGKRGVSTRMASTKVIVDVTSDTMCPWCYVGKRSLEKAVKSLDGELDVEVRWHPFYLNPGWPTPGESYPADKHLAEKYGPGTIERMGKKLQTVSNEYGLGIDWGYIRDNEKDAIVFNTRRSHLLIAAAGQDGPEVQNELVNILFNAYFENNVSLDDDEVLLRKAREAGLSAQAISEWQNGKFDEQVDLETRKNFTRGIRGVPHFEIRDSEDARPIVLSGGQPPRAFQYVFKQLQAQARAGGDR